MTRQENRQEKRQRQAAPSDGWSRLEALEREALSLAVSEESGGSAAPVASPEQREAESFTPTAACQTVPEEPDDRTGVPYDVPQWRRKAPARDLAGLALSGGGIRSATFNLGLLQELHRQKLLPAFHYLATVSGGGYAGAFWSAWQSWKPDRSGRFPETTREEPEPREVRHLREFGNFLNPRLLMFSFETGRLVAATVGAMLPSLVFALTVLAAVFQLWLGMTWLLWEPLVAVSVATFVVVTLGVQVGLEVLWSRRPEEHRARVSWAVAAFGALLVSGGCWSVLRGVLPLSFGSLESPWQPSHAPLLPLALLMPAAAWGLGSAALLFGRVVANRYTRDCAGRRRVGAIDRALSRQLLAAGGWTVLAGLWLAGQWLAAAGLGGIVSALAAGTAGGSLFGWLRRLLSAQLHKPAGNRWLPRLLPWLLRLLVWAVVAAFAVVAAAAVLAALVRGGRWNFALMAIGTAALLATAAFFFAPEANGFHAFYRARLVRAFLGAANPVSQKLRYATDECVDDDRQLEELPNRPLHLICCTANNLAGDPLANLGRGGESAVLSKKYLQVGSRVIENAKLHRVPSLGDAITASGAALNSHMGDLSVRLGAGSSFVLAALGLRLGLWLPNPLVRSRTLWGRAPHRWPGLLFFRELVGLSTASSSWVHLSDGGHFENLALYELVRRHCRFILLSDCGADPDRAFDDFGNAVRRIREDFGIEIRIDITPLRPDSDGLSRQPVVAGDIEYGPNDHGILIYLKPTRTGREPADVVHYAGRNPDFPHERTLDQFYDEAQWESYRRLGAHVVRAALEGLDIGGNEERARVPAEEPKNERAKEREEDAARARLTAAFLEARYRWLALPPPDAGRFAELAEAWDRLEAEVEAGSPLAHDLRGPVLPRTAREQGHPASPEMGEALVQELTSVRTAVRLMEEAFFALRLDDAPGSPVHQRSLGWLNRMGRWAATERFRAWWPWLEALHDPRFTAFVGSLFRLPAGVAATGRLVKLSGFGGEAGTPGEALQQAEADPFDDLALRSWREIHGDFGAAASVLGFLAPLRLEAGSVLLALLRIEDSPSMNGVARWHTRDLFVPPGFWGVGIGERFLCDALPLLRDIGYGRVEVCTGNDQAGGEAPTTTPDLQSLYTGQGFHREGSRHFVRHLADLGAKRRKSARRAAGGGRTFRNFE